MFGKNKMNEIEKQIRELKDRVGTFEVLMRNFSGQDETIKLILDHLKLVKFEEPGKPTKNVLITKKEKEKRDKRDMRNEKTDQIKYTWTSINYPSISLEQQMDVFRQQQRDFAVRGLFNK